MIAGKYPLPPAKKPEKSPAPSPQKHAAARHPQTRRESADESHACQKTDPANAAAPCSASAETPAHHRDTPENFWHTSAPGSSPQKMSPLPPPINGCKPEAAAPPPAEYPRESGQSETSPVPPAKPQSSPHAQ